LLIEKIDFEIFVNVQEFLNTDITDFFSEYGFSRIIRGILNADNTDNTDLTDICGECK
jgi:hypothetical protein